VFLACTRFFQPYILNRLYSRHEPLDSLLPAKETSCSHLFPRRLLLPENDGPRKVLRACPLQARLVLR
jgi:hypothetical protein